MTQWCVVSLTGTHRARTIIWEISRTARTIRTTVDKHMKILREFRAQIGALRARTKIPHAPSVRARARIRRGASLSNNRRLQIWVLNRADEVETEFFKREREGNQRWRVTKAKSKSKVPARALPTGTPSTP